MRRITRLPLELKDSKYLNRRQVKAKNKQEQGSLNPKLEWESARNTERLRSVLSTLHKMMGPRERCMYCMDSHGSDIDHFWPKASYPDKMFQWLNMLLCCTECGRLKGNQFLLTSSGLPLLIDPTVEDPWHYLDFDPETGNIVPRFDKEANAEAPKGTETVRLLQLDRREALATGYRKTFLRLSKIIHDYLEEGETSPQSSQDLIQEMRNTDDHGLLEWCFLGTGRSVAPFRELYRKSPRFWEECEIIVRRLQEGER